MFVKMFLINPIKKLEGSVSIDVGINDFLIRNGKIMASLNDVDLGKG